MIFLPQSDQSLSEICGELPDGFYGLPRFELPEWLWERLPRSDPGRAMAEIERLGPGLRLDEPTVSNEWIRFDAPGDFQLILREDFLAIDGLDEEMLLGYHVDSNLSRRMLLHRGSIESLGESLAGYHCNHNREPTVYHGTGKVANDLERFVVKVDRPELPAQRDNVGPRRRRARGGAGPRAVRTALRRRAGRRDSEQRRPSNAVRRRPSAVRADVRLRPRPALHRRLTRGLALRRDDRVHGGEPRSRADARNGGRSGSGSGARWRWPSSTI